jgi:hypothetical protein
MLLKILIYFRDHHFIIYFNIEGFKLRQYFITQSNHNFFQNISKNN